MNAMGKGFWALMLPVVILGGIYSGMFTATEAAARREVSAVGSTPRPRRRSPNGRRPRATPRTTLRVRSLLTPLLRRAAPLLCAAAAAAPPLPRVHVKGASRRLRVLEEHLAPEGERDGHNRVLRLAALLAVEQPV